MQLCSHQEIALLNGSDRVDDRNTVRINSNNSK